MNTIAAIASQCIRVLHIATPRQGEFNEHGNWTEQHEV
jgi:hypothetical protein